VPERETTNVAGAAAFRTTHWSVVLAAGHSGTAEAHVALEQLCRIYFTPLYAYLRRQGFTQHDAQDLVQGLFASLLERDEFASVDRSRGKFRSFLLASLKHFVSNEQDRARALKRGGRCSFVPLNDGQAEEHFLAARDLSPDEIYDQSWALALIEHTVDRLRKQYAASDRAALFDALEPYLSGDRAARPYADVAARLNLGESGVKMAVQRMRRRFGELLRNEIAQTVNRPEEVDEEIRAFFSALRG
jgi:RNA polymerase sigma-70 factor (ECF subfamily)